MPYEKWYNDLRAACVDYHSYETGAREKMAAYRVILSHIKREPEKEARADAELAEQRYPQETYNPRIDSEIAEWLAVHETHEAFLAGTGR